MSGFPAGTQGHSKQNRLNLYLYADVHLTAAGLGLPVLTANRGDFDLLQQAIGKGSFIYYDAPP